MNDLEFLPEQTKQPVAQPGTAESRAEDPVPSRPSRLLRPLGARSLTARLVVGVVSLVVVLVLAVSAGTYFALSSFLLNRLDQQLYSTSDQNAIFLDQCLERASVDATNDVSCFYGPSPTQPEWVAVLNSRGVPIVSRIDVTDYSLLVLTAGQRHDLLAHAGTVRTIGFDSEQLRVQARTSRSGLLVITGLSTDEVDRTLRRVIRQELLIGSIAVGLALIATTFGVQFSLRKLRRVTTTANEVAAELSPTGAGLERRVDVEDDGTEVGQLAESMNTLLSAVETQFTERLASEARLRQFLADASHELRTPLTSIRGYAELARMQRAAGADAEDNLARIESEGTRMSRLVEDLLMLARSDQPADTEPVRELVDVTELLQDVRSTSHAAFPERPIELQSAPHLHVLGDPDQLLRAVRNLVANAAVHTAAARPILIRSMLSSPDGALIQVIDGGPGLPPEEAAHVFERFWRADKARTRARGGTGLGLSIVASIVAAHGGTVRFDSDVDTGSTVGIWLPAVTGLTPQTVLPEH